VYFEVDETRLFIREETIPIKSHFPLSHMVGTKIPHIKDVTFA